MLFSDGPEKSAKKVGTPQLFSKRPKPPTDQYSRRFGTYEYSSRKKDR
jgi:hypothetical protein